MQTCINFVEQQLKFSHFEGGIILDGINLIVWCLSICKNKRHPSVFFRYCKDITNLLFWVLWACLAMTGKNNITSLLKTFIFIPHIFLRNYKHFANLFWVFWQVWPHPPKVIALSCRKHWSLVFFTDITLYIILQSDWLKTFWGLWRKVKNQKKFHSTLFFGKTKSFPKKSEYSIFGPFLPKLENYIHDYKNINFRNGSINTKMNKYMLTVCHAFSSKCTKDPKAVQLWFKTFHIFDVWLGYGIISTHFVKKYSPFSELFNVL